MSCENTTAAPAPAPDAAVCTHFDSILDFLLAFGCWVCACVLLVLAVLVCKHRRHPTLRPHFPRLLVPQLSFGALYLALLPIANDHFRSATVQQAFTPCRVFSAVLPYTAAELPWCIFLLTRLSLRFYVQWASYSVFLVPLCALGGTLLVTVPSVVLDFVYVAGACVVCVMEAAAQWRQVSVFLFHALLVAAYAKLTLRTHPLLARPDLARALVVCFILVLVIVGVLVLVPDHSSELRRAAFTMIGASVLLCATLVDIGPALLAVMRGLPGDTLYMPREGSHERFVLFMGDPILRAAFFDYVRVAEGAKPAHPFLTQLVYALLAFRHTESLRERGMMISEILDVFCDPAAWERADDEYSSQFMHVLFRPHAEWPVTETEAAVLRELQDAADMACDAPSAPGLSELRLLAPFRQSSAISGRYTQILRQTTPRSACERIAWLCSPPFTRAHYVGPLPRAPECSVAFTQRMMAREHSIHEIFERLRGVFTGRHHDDPFEYGEGGTFACDVYMEWQLAHITARYVKTLAPDADYFVALERWTTDALYYVHFGGYQRMCARQMEDAEAVSSAQLGRAIKVGMVSTPGEPMQDGNAGYDMRSIHREGLIDMEADATAFDMPSAGARAALAAHYGASR